MAIQCMYVLHLLNIFLGVFYLTMDNKHKIRELIDRFMNCKRIAFVGLSSDQKSFSRALFNDFLKRGYDIVPVNPSQTQINDLPCYKKINDIKPPVEAVLIMTKPHNVPDILEDCNSAGIKLIWLYRSMGQGAVSPEAVKFGRDNNLDLIPGYCPYMFWKDSGFVHGLHRLIMKIGGKFPQ